MFFAVVVVVFGACVVELPKVVARKKRCVNEATQAVKYRNNNQEVSMEVTKAGSNAQASVSNVSKVEGGVESVSWLHVTSNANEALKKAYAVGDADMCLAIVIQGYS